MSILQTPVIVSACRTPVGKFGRASWGFTPARLGSDRGQGGRLAEPGSSQRTLDEVIIGNVISAGLGQNVARQAAIYAGIPVQVGSTSVNMVCGSGMKSVMLAAQAIKAEDREIVDCGWDGEHEQLSVPGAPDAVGEKVRRREAGGRDDTRRALGRLQRVPHGHHGGADSEEVRRDQEAGGRVRAARAT